MVNIGLYLGDNQFKPRPSRPIFYPTFLVGPLSLSKQIPGEYLESHSINASVASFHVTSNLSVINSPAAYFQSLKCLLNK